MAGSVAARVRGLWDAGSRNEKRKGCGSIAFMVETRTVRGMLLLRLGPQYILWLLVVTIGELNVV